MQQNQTYVMARVVADQNLALSSTVLQNITKLIIPVIASGVYKVRLTLLVIGKADSDIKATIAGPSGITGAFDLITVNPGVAAIGTGVAVSLADDTLSTVIMEGVVIISTTAGNIQAQAAQNVSQADQLTIKKGSSLELWQISATT